MNNLAEIRSAHQLIEQAQKIVIVTHIRPDGDAIGSMLGFGLSLEASGKSVQMVSADGVPSTFRFLKGSDRIRTKIEDLAGDIDLIAVVDAAELSRVGTVLEGYSRPQLSIDHHITNTGFAQVNLIDTTAVASAEVLAILLAEWGLPFTQPVAEALLAGLLTDTIGFRTNNMSTRALQTAISLMEYGADLSEIYRKALLQRSYSAIQFWGYGLSRLQREGRIVWATLTMEERKLAGYSGRDDADLINVLSSIEDMDVAVIFVEQPDGSVKVSWRAQREVDVSVIAQNFGGGGHRAASGATVPGPLAEAQSSVLKYTREFSVPNAVL